jgi:hypothetical protein
VEELFKPKYLTVLFIFSLSLSLLASTVTVLSLSPNASFGNSQSLVPIQGADVSASGLNGFGSSTSDAQGVYNLTSFFDTGGYSVSASASGYVDGQVDNVQVVAGSETTNVDIFLAVSGTISGKVTATLSGLPVQFAYVTAYNSTGDSQSGPSTYTDADGNYEINTNLPSGTYNVTVSSAYNLTVSSSSGYLDKTLSGISVQSGFTSNNVNFALDLSGAISGTVTDSASSLPLQNVVVEAISADGTGVDYALTDSSGKYDLNTNLATGTYDVSVVSATGHTPKTVSGVVVTEGSVTTADIALDPSGRISGRVTSLGAGLGLAGASVYAFSDEYNGFATTNDTGYYNITSGLGTGSYTIYVSYQSSFDFAMGINVVQGSETTNVDFQINVPSSGTITGTVTDTMGAPIESATVSAEGLAGSSFATTDENGVYTIDYGLATGSYNVSLSAFGYVIETETGISVTEGLVTSGVDFVLTAIASGRISGHVYVAQATANDVDFLVVRGANNVVFYRIYNTTTSTWTAWTAVPGSTPNGPSAAVVGNELHLVVRGMNAGQIWHGYVNLTDDSFSGWTLLSGSTPSAPTLTANSTHLCLVVRGSNNVIYYRFYNVATRVWSDWTGVPSGSTSDAPSAVLIDNKLQVVVRGSNNNQIWHGTVDLGTGLFSGWTLLDGATPSSPTLTANSTSLCLVVRGNNNVIYYRCYDLASETWGGWIGFPDGATLDAPAAAITGDSLQIVVRGMHSNQIWHGTLNFSTNDWSGWTPLDGSTPSKPELTS